MSAHAIACRRTDLAEFLAVLLDVLAPLFAFLFEERWTRTPKTTAPTPPASSTIPATSALPTAPGTTSAPAAEVIAAPVASSSIPASGTPDAEPAPVSTVAVLPEVPVVRSTATETPTAPATAADEPRPGPAPDAPSTPAAAPQPTSTPAPVAIQPALFMKQNGRYRPAPTGHAGPTFRRETKGKRTRFVRA